MPCEIVGRVCCGCLAALMMVIFFFVFRCKFGQLGPGKGQFNSPHGFCLGMDEDIVVADTNNHRVQVFEKTGDFKYQFGIPGWYSHRLGLFLYSCNYML
jgi:tripartite motif-containing protein 2/3